MDTITAHNIPKVCTWQTFYNRAFDSGLIEPVFDNIFGEATRRVEGQAKAEGLTLYTFNKNTMRGTAVGTYRNLKMTRELWYELATRAGVTFTAKIN